MLKISNNLRKTAGGKQNKVDQWKTNYGIVYLNANILIMTLSINVLNILINTKISECIQFLSPAFHSFQHRGPEYVFFKISAFVLSLYQNTINDWHLLLYIITLLNSQISSRKLFLCRHLVLVKFCEDRSVFYK